MIWNVLFTGLFLVPIVIALFMVVRTEFRSRAQIKRMDQFGRWMEKMGVQKRLGRLSEEEWQQAEQYALRSVSSRGTWDYRGPWEKT